MTSPLTEVERRFADAYISEELALVKGPAVTWAVEHGIKPLEMIPLIKARAAEPGFDLNWILANLKTTTIGGGSDNDPNCKTPELNLEMPWENADAFRVRMKELTSEPAGT